MKEEGSRPTTCGSYGTDICGSGRVPILAVTVVSDTARFGNSICLQLRACPKYIYIVSFESLQIATLRATGIGHVDGHLQKED